MALVDKVRNRTPVRNRASTLKYNLEVYFGIDVQMKVIDLEF
jgi:hypothetical protein